MCNCLLFFLFAELNKDGSEGEKERWDVPEEVVPHMGCDVAVVAML